MALQLLGSSASSVKYFEIRSASRRPSSDTLTGARLERDILVVRGQPRDASSVQIKGTVVLCLAEPLTIKRISLSLSGTCKISWPETIHSGRMALSRKVRDETVFYRKDWSLVDLCKSKSDALPAGNYEYAFDVVFGGDMAESVEGLDDAWIVYRLKATIERGRLAKDVQARKHLRIVRTFEPGALEPLQSTVRAARAASSCSLTARSIFRTSGPIAWRTRSARPARPTCWASPWGFR